MLTSSQKAHRIAAKTGIAADCRAVLDLMGKEKILDSWKEIAAYLGRKVRTCQAWERELGLPVHRLDGSPKARVFAYAAELDAWRDAKGQLADNGLSPANGGNAFNAPPRPSGATSRRLTRNWLLAALAAGPLLAAAAAVLVVRHYRPAPALAVGRFTIKVEPGLWLEGGRRPWEMEFPCQTAMDISSDGRFVVYCAIEENPGPKTLARLYLRMMDRSEATPITGTEGGMYPFLSPNGRWVGFWSAGWVRKVPVEGGTPTALYDTNRWLYGASWGRDNSIVIGDGQTRGLARVSAEGGKPEALTTPDPKQEEWSHRLPHWLPDGKSVLFTLMRHGLDRQPALGLFRLDTREYSVLLEDAADARYVPTGHLVFLRQGTLMAVRFDLDRLKVIGQPFVLLENVMQGFSTGEWFHTGAGQFAVSDTGTLVYAPGGVVPDPTGSLVWVDRRGTEEPVTALRLPFYMPRLSPDGKRIAYVTLGREGRLWVYDLGSGTNTPLTDEGRANYPIWSPDGKRIIFSWHKSLADNLFCLPYDGSGPMERLTTSEPMQTAGSMSPDGKTLALMEITSDTGGDILMLDVPSGRITPFLNSPADWEVYPEFSPDGRWLAYQSHESGRDEIWVREFPGPGAKHVVSAEGGAMPLWARDGKQLFWVWEEQVWAADVRTDGRFAAGKPRVLFRMSGLDWGSLNRSYDLSLDGRRFLMVKYEPKEPAPVTEMILVENWFLEINRFSSAAKR